MIRLLDQPHHRARALLATGAPVYLGVDPVEFHGPHLSLRNDAVISRGLIPEIHARLAPSHPDWPLLVADSLEIGVAPTPGPGSRHVPYPAARAAIRDACDALADLGARAVVLATFHGGPLHNLALQAGVDHLARRGVVALAPMNVLLAEMLEGDPSRFAGAVAMIDDPAARAAVLADLMFDFHAGYFETSVTLALDPETVSDCHRLLPPCPVEQDPLLLAASRLAARLGARALARELSFVATGAAWMNRRPFGGYTGRPHLASAEAGAFFVREIADRFAAAVEATIAGAPPPAAMLRWFPWLTLNGRLGHVNIPLADIEATPPVS